MRKLSTFILVNVMSLFFASVLFALPTCYDFSISAYDLNGTFEAPDASVSGTFTFGDWVEVSSTPDSLVHWSADISDLSWSADGVSTYTVAGTSGSLHVGWDSADGGFNLDTPGLMSFYHNSTPSDFQSSLLSVPETPESFSIETVSLAMWSLLGFDYNEGYVKMFQAQAQTPSNPVPEPSTLLLMGFGVAATARFYKGKKKSN